MRVRRDDTPAGIIPCDNKACNFCFREASPKEIMEAQAQKDSTVIGPAQEVALFNTSAEEVSLPEDDELRGQYPMADGLLDYFPNALAEVSRISKRGSDKHNIGQPMHWARNKSTDHRNKIMRHLVDAGRLDSEGVRHSANLAWRALALLQEELEREEGYPMSRASRK